MGEITPKETKKIIFSKTGVVLRPKAKKTVRAGSYNKKKRKGYEKMLEDAGKI